MQLDGQEDSLVVAVLGLLGSSFKVNSFARQIF